MFSVCGHDQHLLCLLRQLRFYAISFSPMIAGQIITGPVQAYLYKKIARILLPFERHKTRKEETRTISTVRIAQISSLHIVALWSAHLKSWKDTIDVIQLRKAVPGADPV